MKKLIIYLLFALCLAAGYFYAAFEKTQTITRNRTDILCVGDSITADSYPQRLQAIFTDEENKNVKVVNMGKNGFTSGEYLGFLRKNNEWREDFPDWVLIQLGTNDVRNDEKNTPTPIFVKNMESIIRTFLKEGYKQKRKVRLAIAKIPPITVCKSFDETASLRVVNEINPAIEYLAERFNIPVMDNYQLFLDNPEALPGIHPTQSGYKLIALSWYKFLKDKI